MEKLLSVLLHAVNQSHIFHLQTTSYAEHMALGAFYKDIQTAVDGVAEMYQGKYGIAVYKAVNPLENYVNSTQVVNYLVTVAGLIEVTKGNTDSFIANELETIEALIYRTIYKIKYLK